MRASNPFTGRGAAGRGVIAGIGSAGMSARVSSAEDGAFVFRTGRAVSRTERAVASDGGGSLSSEDSPTSAGPRVSTDGAAGVAGAAGAGAVVSDTEGEAVVNIRDGASQVMSRRRALLNTSRNPPIVVLVFIAGVGTFSEGEGGRILGRNSRGTGQSGGSGGPLSPRTTAASSGH
jgi:hypothetical protein